MHYLFVPVSDSQGRPLMPTAPARARRWIRSGKAAAFWKGGIFGLRLNVEPASHVVQPTTVGIDPGSKREGHSVLCAAHTYLNIQAEARAGVKEAEKDSTRMRRTRRDRKTPYRRPRQNRHQSKKKLPVVTRQGYETKALREQLGLKKTRKKLAEVWEAHCVDSCALARAAVGGATAPDNTRLVCMAPFAWHHPATNKRLTQTASVADCTLITRLRWRTRLVPLTQAPASPAPNEERLLPPMPQAEGIRRRRFYEKDW